MIITRQKSHGHYSALLVALVPRRMIEAMHPMVVQQ
jgi:hypothetical protein